MTNYSHNEDEILGKAYDSRLMKRLLAYLKPYRWLIVLSVFILLASSAAQLAGPYLTKVAIDNYISKGDTHGLFRIIMLFLAAVAAGFSLQYAQVYLMQYVGQMAMRDLRLQLFRHVIHLDLAYYDRNPIGRTMTRLTSDIQVLHEMFTSGVVAIFGDIFMLIGIMVVLLALNTTLALVVFMVLPLIIIATAVFRVKVRQSYRDVRTWTAKINAYLQEHLSGITIVQSFAVEKKVSADYDVLNGELRNAHLRGVFYYSVFFPVIELIGAIALALIIAYGGSKILSGTLTLGALVAFIQYADRFFQPIRDLSEKYNVLQSAMASSERIFNLMDTKSSLINPASSAQPIRFKGEIEFRNLSYSYQPGVDVLHDINFRVKAGEKVAIVGATGSGKTTLISLLCRFYEYDKGDILIDGRSIKTIDEKVLRSNMALVLQDVFLFSGSVERNIRLRSEDIPFETVIKAAKEIGAHQFIENLENGYEHSLGERGLNLSVGQKQLIAFARALAFNPTILILDEATSSVDTETEMTIRKALKKLFENRTAIIVAHRLSTIKDADRIIVMHKGKIRESGNHAELLKEKGIYYRLYQLQYKDQEVSFVGRK